VSLNHLGRFFQNVHWHLQRAASSDSNACMTWVIQRGWEWHKVLTEMWENFTVTVTVVTLRITCVSRVHNVDTCDSHILMCRRPSFSWLWRCIVLRSGHKSGPSDVTGTVRLRFKSCVVLYGAASSWTCCPALNWSNEWVSYVCTAGRTREPCVGPRSYTVGPAPFPGMRSPTWL